MNYEGRPRDLLRLVKPQQVRSYALAKGWHRMQGVNGDIALYDRPGDQWRQLIVPMDETFHDYDKRGTRSAICCLSARPSERSRTS